MNRTVLFAFVALTTFSGVSHAATAVPSQACGGLIPPPAIYMPYGGKVITDINLSDGDVLGIIKQIIPSIGEIVKGAVPLAKNNVGASEISQQAMEKLVSSLDFQVLADIVKDIKNIRAVVVVYNASIKPDDILKQFETGVSKAGKFSRLLSDTSSPAGTFALYAEPNNAGYIGFAYDPGKHKVCAARVIGFIDIPKLMKWVTDAAKPFMGMIVPSPEEEQPAENQPDAPQSAPAEAPAAEQQ